MSGMIGLVGAEGASADLSEAGAEMARESWQWVSGNSADLALASAIAVLIALVLIGLRSFGHKMIRQGDDGINWRTIFGRVLSRTSLFFIVMASARLVSGQADTPDFIQRPINILFVVAAAFQAAIWVREFVLGLVEQRIDEGEEKSTLGSAIGIIRLLVTVALFAIAIILILDNLGVNVTGLVAGLGIGGIAIGLAAQGMSNREIAEALFVTVKTVEWHLKHAYRKLGVGSRRELGTALLAD
jgi:small-conductance mechanosensitive channel